MRIDANTENLIFLKEKINALSDAVSGNFSALIRDYGLNIEEKAYREFTEIATAFSAELKRFADGIDSDIGRRIEIIDIYNDTVYGHSV